MIVEENPARRRFEILVDDALAGFIDYQVVAGTMVLAHTEVDKQFEGKGVGSALARGTLDQLRDRGEQVRVTCPFLLAFLDRHPEYASVVIKD
ncbi:GNAT family N-acetyltransferase [Micromonospora sp. WMMD1102]|uniref:GNAT family N-acetyltransferase n=1 Tax=Micromonospora sp. WMMD1102 TaxID=3016105 RepID=UPI00241515B8|nr:GNAT family N-acetyltransferase [Micromonospora sp. WMMD1102]MDG4788340.1 GNAT family N-acetyltransferase [Micromonospora sp. WMMD1102]